MTVLFLCMLFFSTLVKLSTSSPSSDCATCNPGNITFYAEMDFSGASESKHITWGQCDQVPAPDTLGDTGSSWQVGNRSDSVCAIFSDNGCTDANVWQPSVYSKQGPPAFYRRVWQVTKKDIAREVYQWFKCKADDTASYGCARIQDQSCKDS